MRLLRPDVRCPRCGSPPAFRLWDSEVERYAGDEPERRVGTIQCQRRDCGTVYDLTARAIQRAA